MTERKYSIPEIDQMRKATKRMFSFWRGRATAAEIEDRLRTYMLNGTRPDELDRAAEEFAEADFAAFQNHQRIVGLQATASVDTHPKGGDAKLGSVHG